MKVNVTQSDCMWPHVLCSPWNSPGQNTGVGSRSLLQAIFPTQGLNSGLLQCRQILYKQSQQGSPSILEWVTYPFSIKSSWPKNWTRESNQNVGVFFTSWATRESLILVKPFEMPLQSCICQMSIGHVCRSLFLDCLFCSIGLCCWEILFRI